MATLESLNDKFESFSSETKELFMRMNEKIDAILSLTSSVRAELLGKIEAVETRMVGRMKEMESRLEAKIDEVDRNLSKRIEEVDKNAEKRNDELAEVSGRAFLRTEKVSIN
jgi:DNA anti-recombination protein RmuC